MKINFEYEKIIKSQFSKFSKSDFKKWPLWNLFLLNIIYRKKNNRDGKKIVLRINVSTYGCTNDSPSAILVINPPKTKSTITVKFTIKKTKVH